MTWKKGTSGNVAGRPKGAKSKSTLRRERIIENTTTMEGIASFIADYTNGNPSSVHSLADDFNDPMLTARDRILIAEKYCQYVFPKRQATDVDMKVDAEASLAEQLADLAQND